jgi:membrane fusion protein (multidrug efflux system)
MQTGRAQLLAHLHQNQAQADAVARQIDLLTAQHDQAAAAFEAAQAQLRLAQIDLRYTRIVAPSDGVISTRQVLPGQFIAAGTQVTSLAALPLVWVIANYKETQLTHVVVGDSATVTVDTFPGVVFHGHVIAISPGAGSEFALLPPDNATGNFTKIVQRVAVKISIEDPGNLAGRLLPGMSVIPTIDTVLPDGSRP